MPHELDQNRGGHTLAAVHSYSGRMAAWRIRNKDAYKARRGIMTMEAQVVEKVGRQTVKLENLAEHGIGALASEPSMSSLTRTMSQKTGTIKQAMASSNTSFSAMARLGVRRYTQKVVVATRKSTSTTSQA